MKDLDQAGKIIAKRLRQLPFRKGSVISTWQAVIEQRAEGKRDGSFSALRAVGNVVKEYIAALPEERQREMWQETGDCNLFPKHPDIALLPELLYPWVCQAVDKSIHRAVRRRMNETYKKTNKASEATSGYARCAPPEAPQG